MNNQTIMKLHGILMTINLRVEQHKFFYIYLKIHSQNYQNNPLSTDPFFFD
jgi:hypothetical protein